MARRKRAMDESALKAWEAFYVIVGSSAGALTGLQFVVLTLITESGEIRGSEETLAAFGSPNVVHFCSALLISAIFSAPWPHHTPLGLVAALLGVAGLFYSVAVMRRALRQKDYKPVWEDWVWHVTLPKLAYATLVVAGYWLSTGNNHGLYLVGASTLLLIFIGIHNAWDTVMYVTVQRTREQRAKRAAARAARGARPTEPTTAE